MTLAEFMLMGLDHGEPLPDGRDRTTIGRVISSGWSPWRAAAVMPWLPTRAHGLARGGSGGRRGRAARPPVVDLVPLFLVLVTFAAALTSLQRARPEPRGDSPGRAEARIERVKAVADLDDAGTALGRFARTAGRVGRAGESLVLDIEPRLIFEPEATAVRREALVLLFRLARAVHDSSGDLRLLMSADDRAAPARLAALADELRLLGIPDERLVTGVRSPGSAQLQLRLDGGLAP